MATDSNEPTGASEPADRRRLVGIVAGIVVTVTALSAVVGYAVPLLTGLDEVTVLAITFTVSPGAFALYAGIATTTFLVTLLLVVRVISTFDELDEFEDVD